MLREMCSLTLRDRTRTAALMDCVGVVSVEEVVRHGRLRWYDYIEHKNRE